VLFFKAQITRKNPDNIINSFLNILSQDRDSAAAGTARAIAAVQEQNQRAFAAAQSEWITERDRLLREKAIESASENSFFLHNGGEAYSLTSCLGV
jgi:hypothetical protein